MVFASRRLLPLFHIEHSHPSALFANNQAFAPLHARNIPFNQFLRIVSGRLPHIDCIIQDNANQAVLAPVELRGVEVVFEFGRIEHFIGSFGESS